MKSLPGGRDMGTVAKACVCVPQSVLQLVPVRRGGALEDAGGLQSFIFPSSIFVALALDKERSHWLISCRLSLALPPLSPRTGTESKSRSLWVSCRWAPVL